MDSEGVAAVLLGERKSCAPISSASTLRSANCCGHSSRAGRRAAATARDRGQLGQLGPRSFHPRLAAAGGGARLAALLCAPVNEHARGRVLSLPPSCNGVAPRSATARSRRKDSTPTAKKPRCPQQAEGRARPFVRLAAGIPRCRSRYRRPAHAAQKPQRCRTSSAAPPRGQREESSRADGNGTRSGGGQRAGNARSTGSSAGGANGRPQPGCGQTPRSSGRQREPHGGRRPAKALHGRSAPSREKAALEPGHVLREIRALPVRGRRAAAAFAERVKGACALCPARGGGNT